MFNVGDLVIIDNLVEATTHRVGVSAQMKDNMEKGIPLKVTIVDSGCAKLEDRFWYQESMLRHADDNAKFRFMLINSEGQL